MWVKPLWADIQGLNSSKQELQTAINNMKERAKDRDRLLEKYNAIAEEDLARLNEMIPPDVDIAKLLVNMDDLAKTNGLILKRIDAKESKEGSAVVGGGPQNFEPISLELSVAGSYQSFRNYLAALEKNLRLIDVADITFSASEKDSYEFTIRAVIYSQKKQ